MIALRGVRKAYGARVVVDDLSLDVASGSFTALIGPSGCGKSTTLRMINGLITADAGSIAVDGQDVSAADKQALRRRIGYAIQAVGLFPHWTVSRNIATVPRLLGWPEPRVAARVDALLRMLELAPERYAGAMPRTLSGGQQQRVGVARALAADPPLLLMDEPFGALDPLIRGALQDLLRRIQAETRKTIVFVTHDIDEALRLADRIVIMQDGRIAQQGTPLEILRQPASEFVARFVGGDDLPLRLLAARRVHEVMRPGSAAAAGPGIARDATLRDAFALMLSQHAETLRVLDAQGDCVGGVALADIVA